MLIQTLKRTGFGFVLGMAVGNLIAALSGHPDIVSPELLARMGSLSASLLVQTLLSGVIGGVAWAGISLYDLERWPLLTANLTHFALVMAVFIPIAHFLGWTETATDTLLMAGIMFAAHFSIFLIMCAYYRAQMREMNRLQEAFLREATRG